MSRLASETVRAGAARGPWAAHQRQIVKGDSEHVEGPPVRPDELDERGFVAEDLHHRAGRTGHPPPVRATQGDGVKFADPAYSRPEAGRVANTACSPAK